jgi:hypothetical protein
MFQTELVGIFVTSIPNFICVAAVAVCYYYQAENLIQISCSNFMFILKKTYIFQVSITTHHFTIQY